MAALKLPLTLTGPNLPMYISWNEIVCHRDPVTASCNVRRSHLQVCCPASRDLDDKLSRFCMKDASKPLKYVKYKTKSNSTDGSEQYLEILVKKITEENEKLKIGLKTLQTNTIEIKKNG